MRLMGGKGEWAAQRCVALFFFDCKEEVSNTDAFEEYLGITAIHGGECFHLSVAISLVIGSILLTMMRKSELVCANDVPQLALAYLVATLLINWLLVVD